jgi:hypothetical protein
MGMDKRGQLRLSRPNEIANWIMFGNRQRRRPVLLAEGSSDVRVYAFIVNENCRIFYADGKEIVLAVMALIRKAAYPGVVAIVDADFGRLFGRLHDADDVISTDTHDIETLVIRQVAALARFVVKYGLCETKSRDFDSFRLRAITTQLQENVMQSGSIIGYVRFISARGGLAFDFKQLVHSRVYRVDAGRLQIDMGALEIEIMGRCNTSNSPVKWAVITGELDNLRAKEGDLWQVCCGHDLTNLLTIYLHAAGIKITRAQVESDLSLFFDMLEFTATAMYSKLAQWEIQHPDYLLLRRPTPPATLTTAVPAP